MGEGRIDGLGSPRDEQMTMMTLWSIFRSPLMVGGELRDNDPWTLSLLTNPEVLEVNRDSTENRPVSRQGDRIVWTARSRSGAVLVALFNVGEEPVDRVRVVDGPGYHRASRGARSLETGGCGPDRRIGGAPVPPHGAALLKLS